MLADARRIAGNGTHFWVARNKMQYLPLLSVNMWVLAELIAA